MKALLVHSTKFKKYEDFYYSRQFSYGILKERYLRYVNELHVIGRVEKVSSAEDYNISSGENVYHKSVPNIMSPIKLLKNKNKVSKSIENYLLKESIDIIVARLPSAYSLMAIKIADKLGITVIVEMVGDPLESLWNHGSLKGKLYAPISYLKHKKQLKKTKNIIFVTKNYLQKRYQPDFRKVNTTNISNVDLTVEQNFDIEKKKLHYPFNNEVVKISTIGDFTSKYKDIDTAISFINGMRKLGYNVHLYILGKGDKTQFSKMIKKYNVEPYIHFTSEIKGGNDVLKWLDNFDLYIHPSLTEGLPRALIEAMSRGLPAIGTKVGGIPELLDKKMLVGTRSPAEMIFIADNLLNDINFYNEQVEYNYKKSKYYYKEVLTEKRDKFWENLLH